MIVTLSSLSGELRRAGDTARRHLAPLAASLRALSTVPPLRVKLPTLSKASR